MECFHNWTNTAEFRQEAIKFDKYGTYCEYPEGTYEYEKYWDQQEEYFKNGFTNSKGLWIPGSYYMYLNFARIYNKEKKRLTFPDFWDTDAWVFTEQHEAKTKGFHQVILKSRQKGGSLKYAWLLVEKFYFQRESISYAGSYIEDKVNRLWEMIEHMANHLDRHTAWGKNKEPYRKDFWKAQFKERIDGKDTFSGFKSELHKVTFKLGPSVGVGGAVDMFVYEEAGLSPTLLKTLEYIDPATLDGSIRTGQMLVVGAVGELKEADNLKTLFYEPQNYGFASYENNWDDKKVGTYCGLFIPEYFSLKGFIDEEGNSKIEEAKKYCLAVREEKKKKSPENYRLYISQHPFTPDEAFAYREESKMPIALINEEQERLKESSSYGVNVTLERRADGTIYHILNNKQYPIMEFPIKKTEIDKRGCVVIYDFPIPNAPIGTYFAGVDPVKNIKTTTGVSLASIYIVKRRSVKDGVIEPEQVVAQYVGRYDDPKETHEIMEKLIEFYKARALVENDVTSFIDHLIAKKKQYLLLKKKDVSLIQDLNLNPSTHAIYGISGSQKVANELLDMTIDFLKEEQDKVFAEDGTVVKIVRGVNMLRDVMLLEELKVADTGVNVDRVKAFGYALLAAKANAQHINYIDTSSYDYVEENRKIISEMRKSPFIHFGNKTQYKRSPFKHIR